jgi:hypothetical protein
MHFGHKMGLNKFEVTEGRQRLFSDYNGIKTEINNGKIVGKFQNTWKLSKALLTTYESKRNLKKK